MNMEAISIVDREKELSELTKHFLKMKEGSGSVIFISGEAGAGKTALLEEFLRVSKARCDDIISGWGECNAQVGVGDAYLPFKEILWNLVGNQNSLTKPVGNAKTVSMLVIKCLYEVAPDIISCFVPFAGIGLKGLQVILGQLGIKPRAKDTQPAAIEQNRIFEQYHHILTSLSQHGSILLIIEDLQWADESSIALLFYLGRRINKERILIVASYRPYEISIWKEGREHSLLRVINELRRYGSHVISLDRIRGNPEDEVRIDRFIRQYLNFRFPNHTFPESFILILNHRTAGNPLFLKELLENMYELGEIAEVGGRWRLVREINRLDCIPERVEAIIQQRVGRLTDDLKRLLTIASVEGEDFTAQVLAKLQGLEEEKILERLIEELGRIHQLINEKGEKIIEKDTILSFFNFRHRLMQEHLYHAIGESQRRLMHRKVGECLESLYGSRVEEISVQLAHHFELAHIYRKALHYWHISACQAAKTFATNEAIHNYNHALELWGKIFPKPEEAKEEDLREKLIMLRELGDIFEYRGDTIKAEQCHAEALTLAKIVKDDREEILALDNLGDVYLLRDDYENAIAYYKKAEELAKNKGYEDILAEIYCDLADLYDDIWEKGVAEIIKNKFHIDPINEVKRYCQMAIELSDKLGSYEQLLKAYMNFSIYYLRQRDHDNALLWARKSYEIANQYGLDQHPLNILGEVYRLKGDLDIAKEYYLKFKKWAEQSGSARKLVIALNNLGIIYSDKGDFINAHKFFDESLFLNEEVQHLGCQIETHIMKGITYQKEGKINESMNEFKEALKKMDSLDPNDNIEKILKKISQKLLFMGEISKSEEVLKFNFSSCINEQ